MDPLGHSKPMEPWPDRLRRMRKAAGYTQAGAAEALGIAAASIAQWEIGRTKPSRDRLMDVSRIYKVSVEEVCGTDLPKPKPTPDRPDWALRFAAAIWAVWGDDVELAASPDWLNTGAALLEKISSGKQEADAWLLMRLNAKTGIPLWWFSEGRWDGIPSEIAGRIGAYDRSLIPDHPGASDAAPMEGHSGTMRRRIREE